MSNGRPWSPADTATLRRMARAGYTDGEIGRHIGRHPKCVGEKRREERIEPGQPPALRIVTARIVLRRLLAA